MTRTGAIQPGGEHAGGTGIQREIKYEGRKQMGISRRRRFEMAGISAGTALVAALPAFAGKSAASQPTLARAARRGAKLEQSVRGAKGSGSWLDGNRGKEMTRLRRQL
jgi:hypothetical protein